MFKRNLLNMLKDLNNCNHSRDFLYNESVKDRLNKSIIAYYRSIMNSSKYLQFKDELKVLRAYNKER